MLTCTAADEQVSYSANYTQMYYTMPNDVKRNSVTRVTKAVVYNQGSRATVAIMAKAGQVRGSIGVYGVTSQGSETKLDGGT